MGLKLHLKCKRWSCSNFWFEEESTVELLYDLFWYNEAKTDTIGVLFLGVLDESEELEEFLLIGWADANTGVFDGDL